MTVLKCIDWAWMNSADLICPSVKMTGKYLLNGQGDELCDEKTEGRAKCINVDSFSLLHQ